MMFAPPLELPEPTHFFGKEIETADSEKKDRARPREKRGDAVSLPQCYREAGPDEKPKKNKDAAENGGRDVSPSISHPECDSEEAEERAGQRVRETIPVLCFVGGSEAIIEPGSIKRQAYHIGPGEFIGGEKSCSKSFWRGRAFGKNKLVEKRSKSFLTLRRGVIGTTSALKVPDASLVVSRGSKDFRQIFPVGFGSEKDFEVFGLLLVQMNPADVPDVALGRVGQKGGAVDDLLEGIFLDRLFFDLLFHFLATGLGSGGEREGENIKNHGESGTADEKRFG